MKKIKNFQEWLNENAQLGKTSIDNVGGFIYSPIAEEGDGNESNYMFFSNLRRLKELSSMILSMDKSKIDSLLNSGHDWANDHISSAKTSIEHVFGFFNDELKTQLSESVHDTTDLHRQFVMSPIWWSAWRMENEKKENLKIEKDSFAKTYEVRDKDDKVIFVFDYKRNKIYTNENPNYFTLKDEVSSDEMQKIDDKAKDIKDDLAGIDPSKKEEKSPNPKSKEESEENKKEEE